MVERLSLLKMSIACEMSAPHQEVDDNFVSINLESTESCDICDLDTGEQLTSTCHLCVGMFEPIKLGFNKMPEMLHSGVVAHQSCLVKSHQALSQNKHSYHISPLLHRRGTSIPSHFTTLTCNRLQWLINYARNEDIQNPQSNRLQVRSSPCTRASSPVIFSSLGNELPRRNSENNLRDPSFLELRKSYTKYLYGNSVPKSHSDENVGCKTVSTPSFNVGCLDEQQTKGLNPQPKVPCLESIENQPQSREEKTNELEMSQGKVRKIETTAKVGHSRGSLEDLEPIPNITIHTCSTEEKRTGVEQNPLWSNKHQLKRNQLNKMNAAEMKKEVFALEEIIKGISAELVELLQERDALGQEVRVRNLTIQKLVKLKHSQQDAPIKTTGVGNI